MYYLKKTGTCCLFAYILTEQTVLTLLHISVRSSTSFSDKISTSLTLKQSNKYKYEDISSYITMQVI